MLEFNEGKSGINKVMEKACLKVGACQSAMSEKVTRRHKRIIKLKSSNKAKQRRKELRSIEKHWTDKTEEQ